MQELALTVLSTHAHAFTPFLSLPPLLWAIPSIEKKGTKVYKD